MNLKQLSEQLNLSQTTVSRALNGYPEVSEATRLRVAKAAQKFQYRPNMRARTLATGKSMAIGHVIPMSKSSELVNMVFADFMAGAGLIYAEHGYTMTLSIVQDTDEDDTYRRFEEHGSVDGVLVQAPAPNDPRVEALSALGIPFVVHGRASGIDRPYAWLDVNNTNAMDRATSYLTALGHRRIALINGRETLDFAKRRRAGYLAGLARVGLKADPEIMASGDMSEPNGYDSACLLLGRDDAPTAFVVSSIILALGVRRAVEERGLRLGKDVSVVSYDDDLSYLPNSGDTPLFTTMKSSVHAAGARCAHLLIERIADPATPPPQELWDAELVQGRSTGPGPFV
ncbi:MAG: substrate-binding domain-containing protein [Pseudomonadota bacterium]